MASQPNVKPGLLLAGLQISASILLAALSWQLIEEPIRHGAIGRAWARVRAAAWRPNLRQIKLASLAAGAGTVPVIVVAGRGLSGDVGPSAAPQVGPQASHRQLPRALKC